MSKISTTKKISTSPNKKMNEEAVNEKEFPFEPGNNVINNILNYSKALSIRKSNDHGQFEMVLN
jgi:hypothetical protein